ncbi:TorD/DmsD family molecular chaperone [Nitrosophilus alvini]|uniref:TorD/DmsD family molecular chaperone n=1 Tax=Nitrosophilus alvini TaxID=2714855 RepID=UPI00190B9BF9|nr:molecular chaperone TorD family protein [Nitrosophilus alvini]
MTAFQDTIKRNSLYSLASRIFLQEIDEEVLKKIEEDENFDSLFPTFKDWKTRKEVGKKRLIEEYLNVDYTNIAILHLIPYETFYTRDDQMIESGGANPVVQIYNEYGFRVELDRARVVSPDHIGVELEFMHLLIQSQIRAEESEDFAAATELKKIEKKFLEEHLLKWAPMYLINVANEAATPFYQDSAKFAIEFLLEDYEYLSQR